MPNLCRWYGNACIMHWLCVMQWLCQIYAFCIIALQWYYKVEPGFGFILSSPAISASFQRDSTSLQCIVTVNMMMNLILNHENYARHHMWWWSSFMRTTIIYDGDHLIRWKILDMWQQPIHPTLCLPIDEDQDDKLSWKKLQAFFGGVFIQWLRLH